MSFLKTVGWLCFLVFPAAVCRADVSQIRILFQSILGGQDETRLPNGEDLVGPAVENIIRTASADEIQSLLPLGQKCLLSPKLLVRGAGLTLFLGVSLRLDRSVRPSDGIGSCGTAALPEDRCNRNVGVLPDHNQRGSEADPYGLSRSEG
jgi:hypothetical protein